MTTNTAATSVLLVILCINKSGVVSADLTKVINEHALCIGNEVLGDSWHAEQGNLLGQVEHVANYLTSTFPLNVQKELRDANARVMEHGGGYADMRSILDIDVAIDGPEYHYDYNYDELPSGKLGAYYDWVDHVNTLGDKIQRNVYEQIGARDRRMNGHPAAFQSMLIRLNGAQPDGNHAHAVHIDGLDPEPEPPTATSEDSYYYDNYHYHNHNRNHGWLVSFAITKGAGTMIVTEKENATQTFGHVQTQKQMLEAGLPFDAETMDSHTCNGILLFKESQPHATRHKPTYQNGNGQTIDKIGNALYLSAFQLYVMSFIHFVSLNSRILLGSSSRSSAR